MIKQKNKGHKRLHKKTEKPNKIAKKQEKRKKQKQKIGEHKIKKKRKQNAQSPFFANFLTWLITAMHLHLDMQRYYTQ